MKDSLIERVRLRLAAAIYPSGIPSPYTYPADGLTTLHTRST